MKGNTKIIVISAIVAVIVYFLINFIQKKKISNNAGSISTGTDETTSTEINTGAETSTS